MLPLPPILPDPIVGGKVAVAVDVVLVLVVSVEEEEVSNGIAATVATKTPITDARKYISMICDDDGGGAAFPVAIFNDLVDEVSINIVSLVGSLDKFIWAFANENQGIYLSLSFFLPNSLSKNPGFFPPFFLSLRVPDDELAVSVVAELEIEAVSVAFSDLSFFFFFLPNSFSKNPGLLFFSFFSSLIFVVVVLKELSVEEGVAFKEVPAVPT